jgi:hypothetical protein
MTTPAQPDARSVNIVSLLNDTDILRSLSECIGDVASIEVLWHPRQLSKVTIISLFVSQVAMEPMRYQLEHNLVRYCEFYDFGEPSSEWR